VIGGQMGQDDHVVASAVDNNYLWPLLVMLRSAKSTSSSPFRFILGYDVNSFSPDNVKLVETVCLLWDIPAITVQIDLDFQVDPEGYITSATYARLLLADILPSKFLWIDADVLCQYGWDGIFKISKESTDEPTVIGIKDPLVQFGIPESQSKNAAVQLAGVQYFNAGVVLLDPNKWRLNRAPEKWREAFENSTKLGFLFHDQCILNYLLYDSSKLIPNEFNYLVRSDTGRLVRHPFMIHFAGGFKPWHMPEIALWIVSPKVHRDLYRKYALTQIKVITSISFSTPRIAMRLWNERLRLRKTDTFLSIVNQKKEWWVKRQKVRIYELTRRIWKLIRSLPVIRFIWNRHLEEIVNQRELMITGILKNYEDEKSDLLKQFQDEKSDLLKQFQDERPMELRNMAEISYGRYETFYSKPPIDLGRLFDKYGSDKGTLGNPSVKFPWLSHNYADVYAELFQHSRERVGKVFECGIGTNDETILSNMTSIATPGGSLRAWRDYFPNAIIYGADIDLKVLFTEDRIITDFIDQLDSESIKKYFSNFEKNSFDLMIDDGLHTFEAATRLLENSIDFLSEHGTYIIEDVHYPDVLAYERYLSSNAYLFRIITLERKGQMIGDNILIIIRKR